MSHLELSFLGSPEVSIDYQPVTFPTRKAITLLAYLSVTSQPHARDSLATLFWPELDQTRARASLRHAIWILTRAGLADWLETDLEMVKLKPGFELDLSAFQEKVARSLKHGHPVDAACPECVAWLADAIQLYRGDFLAGFSLRDSPEFDNWQRFQAESLRQKFADALERQANLHNNAEEWEQAIENARHLVSLDPLSEPAQRALMRFYALAGKRGLALKQYEALRQILDRELGAEPEAESRELYEDILAKRLTAVTSPGSSQFEPNVEARPHHNLPLQTTPFIGRQAELATLEKYLGDPNVRLITILGPGGMGKTCLALAAAQAQLNGEVPSALFPHGVFFISLARLEMPDLLVPMMAEALNFRFVENQEAKGQLLRYLRQKKMLLVLDNFEHLRSRAGLLDEILASTAEIKLLVTSREKLNLKAEQVFRISGMDYPEAEGEAKEEASKILADYSAIQLFCERGQRVHPEFALTPVNQSSVVAVCRMLQGDAFRHRAGIGLVGNSFSPGDCQ